MSRGKDTRSNHPRTPSAEGAEPAPHMRAPERTEPRSFLRQNYDGLAPAAPERLALGCQACGRAAIYDVGCVVISAERPSAAKPDEGYGFTRYFRCRACDAPGPWAILPATQLKLMDMMRELIASGSTSARGGAVFIGDMRLFDGTRIRFVTEGEAHLQALIADAPEDPFLHDRLGNLYNAGDRPDLARAAFEAALAIDPGYVGAIFSLGELHEKAGDDRAAAACFHRLLEVAPTDRGTPSGDLDVYLRSALSSLFAIHEKSGGEIPALPASLRSSAPEDALPAIAANVSLDPDGRPRAELDLEPLVEWILARRAGAKKGPA